MNKRRGIRIGVIVVIVGIFLLAGRDYIFPQPMTQVFGIENAEVTKISLLDGTSGISKTITDPQQVKDFMDLFDGAYLWKNPNQTQTSGFIISAVLYSEKEPCSFTFGFSMVQTKGGCYFSSRYFNNSELDTIRKEYGLKH